MDDFKSVLSTQSQNAGFDEAIIAITLLFVYPKKNKSFP